MKRRQLFGGMGFALFMLALGALMIGFLVKDYLGFGLDRSAPAKEIGK